jgi:hypothetical protein
MSWVEFVGWARTSQRLFNALAVAYLLSGALILNWNSFVVIDSRDVVLFVSYGIGPVTLAAYGGFFRGPSFVFIAN